MKHAGINYSNFEPQTSTKFERIHVETSATIEYLVLATASTLDGVVTDNQVMTSHEISP